jgi:hypothetical protein
LLSSNVKVLHTEDAQQPRNGDGWAVSDPILRSLELPQQGNFGCEKGPIFSICFGGEWASRHPCKRNFLPSCLITWSIARWPWTLPPNSTPVHPWGIPERVALDRYPRQPAY